MNKTEKGSLTLFFSCWAKALPYVARQFCISMIKWFFELILLCVPMDKKNSKLQKYSVSEAAEIDLNLCCLNIVSWNAWILVGQVEGFTIFLEMIPLTCRWSFLNLMPFFFFFLKVFFNSVLVHFKGYSNRLVVV